MPHWLYLLDFVCLDIAFSCAAAAWCFRHHLRELRKHQELEAIEAVLRGDDVVPGVGSADGPIGPTGVRGITGPGPTGPGPRGVP